MFDDQNLGIFENDFSSVNQNERQKQIRSLKAFHKDIFELIPESEYQILFNARNEKVVLTIKLSNKFPMLEKPTITIQPSCCHPWVTPPNKVTGSPSLQNFSWNHSDIGRIVQGIIHEFKCNPPSLFSAAYAENVLSIDNSPILADNTTPTLSTDLLLILSSLKPDALKTLSEDGQLLNGLVESLPIYQKIVKERDDLEAGNASLAIQNLKLKCILEDVKAKLLTKIDQISALNEDFVNSEIKYFQLADSISPASIKLKLVRAASDAELESDKIAEAFLDGSIPIESFLTSFLACRQIYHTRKAKEERLGSQSKLQL